MSTLLSNGKAESASIPVRASTLYFSDIPILVGGRQTLVFGTCENHLIGGYQKRRSKPEALLNVFAPLPTADFRCEAEISQHGLAADLRQRSGYGRRPWADAPSIPAQSCQWAIDWRCGAASPDRTFVLGAARWAGHSLLRGQSGHSRLCIPANNGVDACQFSVGGL